MEIFLLVLTIIGIVLLSLLGLVILVLCLALFVPIKYRIHASKTENVNAEVFVHFLYPLVSFRLTYDQDEGIKQKLRICGFSKRAKPEEETDEAAVGDEDVEKKAKTTETKTAETKTSETENASVEGAELINESDLDRVKLLEADTGDSEAITEQYTEGKPQNITDVESESLDEPKKEKWYRKLHGKMTDLAETVKAMWLLFQKKKGLLVEYFQKESTKQAGRFLWSNLKWLLLQMAPKKLEGQIYFGTGEPETTGKIAMVAGICYPIYGQAFAFYPDFEENRIEGEVLAKGRIRLFGIAVRAIKILRNKNLKKVRKETVRVKNRLMQTGTEVKNILADGGKNG